MSKLNEGLILAQSKSCLWKRAIFTFYDTEKSIHCIFTNLGPDLIIACANLFWC